MGIGVGKRGSGEVDERDALLWVTDAGPEPVPVELFPLSSSSSSCPSFRTFLRAAKEDLIVNVRDF